MRHNVSRTVQHSNVICVSRVVRSRNVISHLRRGQRERQHYAPQLHLIRRARETDRRPRRVSCEPGNRNTKRCCSHSIPAYRETSAPWYCLNSPAALVPALASQSAASLPHRGIEDKNCCSPCWKAQRNRPPPSQSIEAAVSRPIRAIVSYPNVPAFSDHDSNRPADQRLLGFSAQPAVVSTANPFTTVPLVVSLHSS